MTPRSLATAASVIALCLAGTALPGFSDEFAQAPLSVAAAQTTAPDFVGLGNWFNSCLLYTSPSPRD